jgi:hypothetical protein
MSSETPKGDVLTAAYAALATFVEAVDENASWRATGCFRWSVRDLVFHCLLDAQSELMTGGGNQLRQSRQSWLPPASLVLADHALRHTSPPGELGLRQASP